jgi:hypothetical protein
MRNASAGDDLQDGPGPNSFYSGEMVLPRILPRPNPTRRRGLGEWPLHGALRWGGAERIARLLIEPAGFDRSD